MAKKGTVTELSSHFPEEEMQKASDWVQKEIAKCREELDQQEGFFADNTDLINLVRKLPEETHHNIMVPFGKAAFFPGRMTNPNKFVVFIGEGYYVERSAKQTVEILKRRSKNAVSTIESLKAIIQELKFKASFIENTAHESAEGLVEIREDYVEAAPSGTSLTSGYRKSDSVPPLEVDNGEAADDDEEYARIFARMTELEKEEEAEESDGSDQDEQIQNEQDNSVRRYYTDQEVRSIPAVTRREALVVSKEGASHGDYPAHSNVVINKDFELPQDERKYPPCSKAVVNKDLELPQVERDYPPHSKAVVNKDLELPQEERDYTPRSKAVVNKDLELPEVEKKTRSPLPASNTAFTGSIVEHAHNIGANAPQQLAGGRSSKPVSRFMMQRK